MELCKIGLIKDGAFAAFVQPEQRQRKQHRHLVSEANLKVCQAETQAKSAKQQGDEEKC